MIVLTDKTYTLAPGVAQPLVIRDLPINGGYSVLLYSRAGVVRLPGAPDVPAGGLFKSGPYRPGVSGPTQIVSDMAQTVRVQIIRDDSDNFNHGYQVDVDGTGDGGGGGPAQATVPNTIFWTPNVPGNTGPIEFTALADAHAAARETADKEGEATLSVDALFASPDVDASYDFENIKLTATSTFQRVDFVAGGRFENLTMAESINFRARPGFNGPIATYTSGVKVEFRRCSFAPRAFGTDGALFKFEAGSTFSTVVFTSCTTTSDPGEAIIEVDGAGTALFVEAYGSNQLGENVFAGGGDISLFGYDPVSSAYLTTEQPLVSGSVSILQEIKAGWVQIGDTQYTEAAPLAIVADTNTQLTNNAGATLLTHKAPWIDGVTDLWSGNELQARKQGESFDLRVTFKSSPALADRKHTMLIDIGGTENEIVEVEQTHTKGAGVAQLMTFDVQYYQLATFLANGGELILRADGNVDIWDITFVIFPK